MKEESRGPVTRSYLEGTIVMAPYCLPMEGTCTSNHKIRIHIHFAQVILIASSTTSYTIAYFREHLEEARALRATQRRTPGNYVLRR